MARFAPFGLKLPAHVIEHPETGALYPVEYCVTCAGGCRAGFPQCTECLSSCMVVGRMVEIDGVTIEIISAAQIQAAIDEAEEWEARYAAECRAQDEAEAEERAVAAALAYAERYEVHGANFAPRGKLGRAVRQRGRGRGWARRAAALRC